MTYVSSTQLYIYIYIYIQCHDDDAENNILLLLLLLKHMPLNIRKAPPIIHACGKLKLIFVLNVDHTLVQLQLVVVVRFVYAVAV